MKRIGFNMKLKKGCAQEYVRRHNEIWPELSDLLSKAGIREYSIFLDRGTNMLFAFQKVDGEKGSQDLSDHPLIQQWWQYMADIMETNPNNSPVSTELEEVFFLD